jgi:hypothetical protein
MKYLSLSTDETQAINSLLDSIFSESSTVSLDDFLPQAAVIASGLPKRVRQFFYEFKLFEPSIGVCVKNNPIDDVKIGPTPDRIPEKMAHSPLSREEAIHILYGSLLGEIFTWSSIQNGNIINEIVPIRENENKPISSGSANVFDLHTEDAFHPYMGDYLGLMCLRNPSNTPTVISYINGDDIGEDIKEILSEPRFVVSANIAHRVDKVTNRVPILFGNIDSPYMRINLNAQSEVDNDKEAKHALKILVDVLRRNAVPVILETGDCFYLDNFRAVHGREAYTPRYDGKDRWLKRIYITRDLRKSRSLRDKAESRIIIAN